jgi:hypothetical protein
VIRYDQAMPAIAPVSSALDLARDGAEHRRGAVGPAILEDIKAVVEPLPRRAGVRLGRGGGLGPFLAADGAVGAIAADVLGDRARPVRAVLFDKTSETNWSLGWHQDRTIVVARRVEVAGFGPWSTKAGLQHVAPPFDLLARMITLRVHLDPVTADNGPLRIAPGSHRLGLVAVDATDAAVARYGARSCLAEAGDIWIYATPILHASDAAVRPGRRRVLQVDYAGFELPGGLAWLGV